MCNDVAYPKSPVRILDTIKQASSNSKDFVRWDACVVDDNVADWVYESRRVLKQGGTLDVVIRPDQSGNNVCVSWLYMLINSMPQWTIRKCPDCNAIYIEAIK